MTLNDNRKEILLHSFDSGSKFCKKFANLDAGTARAASQNQSVQSQPIHL